MPKVKQIRKKIPNRVSSRQARLCAKLDNAAKAVTVRLAGARKAAALPQAFPCPWPGHEWDELLCALPGYDPFDQSVGCWFDHDTALRAIQFIETYIHHAKGTQDAAAGTPFFLEVWEKSIVANLFGWKRANGTRRYRECFIYVPKKNGKTSLAAAILLLVMMTDGEVGGEFYSAAASRDQAGLLFGHVMGMIKAEPELNSRLTIYGAKGGSQQKSVVYEDMSISYKCLSADADTNDGINPHLTIIDELHRHPDGELMEVLIKSTAARAQPLTITTTTADYNRPSVCNIMLKRAKAIRDNKGDPNRVGFDPAFLPVIYEASKKDDYRDPKVWEKANPNLGVTVTYEFFEREALKAQEMPTELNNFLRLHLNIVTDADEVWLSMHKWELCHGMMSGESPSQWRNRLLRELRGRSAFLGLDLSAQIDLTAIVLIFRPIEENGIWVVIPFFWVPAETAKDKERDDHVPYTTWAREGIVTMTDGNEVDLQAIRAKINSLASDYDIREVGYDKWNATEIARQLREDDGLGDKMVEVPQGSYTLSEPMKKFEAMVMGRRIQHGNNPAMNWMIGNLMIQKDDYGNIKPTKKKSTGKIDGPVATFTGMARALAAAPEAPNDLDAEWV